MSLTVARDVPMGEIAGAFEFMSHWFPGGVRTASVSVATSDEFAGDLEQHVLVEITVGNLPSAQQFVERYDLTEDPAKAAVLGRGVRMWSGWITKRRPGATSPPWRCLLYAHTAVGAA